MCHGTVLICYHLRGRKGKQSLEREVHMTSLKQSEAHSAWNSTCFFLGVCESSEDSENSQHLYPSIFFLFFAITSQGKKERLAEVKLFYNGLYVFSFFSLLDLLASVYLREKNVAVSSDLILLNIVFWLINRIHLSRYSILQQLIMYFIS